MSTSLLRFKGKSIWVHTAVAEVWLCAMEKELLLSKHELPEAYALAKEINEALSYRWLDGVLIDTFDKYFSEAHKLNFFISKAKKVNDKLRYISNFDTVVSIENFVANKAYLIPEINMIFRLLSSPSSIPNRPHIYNLEQGWHAA